MRVYIKPEKRVLKFTKERLKSVTAINWGLITPEFVKDRIVELLVGAVTTSSLLDQYGDKALLYRGQSLDEKTIRSLPADLLEYIPVRYGLIEQVLGLKALIKLKSENRLDRNKLAQKFLNSLQESIGVVLVQIEILETNRKLSRRNNAAA